MSQSGHWYCVCKQKNLIIYDSQTFFRVRTIPYAVGFYPVSKILGNFDPGLTNEEIEKCQSETVVMEDQDCTGPKCEYLKNMKLNLKK